MVEREKKPGTTPDPAPGPGDGPFDREINVRAISIFGVSLAAITIACAVLMIFMFQFFQARQVSMDPEPSPMVDPSIQRLPPEPRLQANPPTDLAAMRAEEQATLEGYGWVDETTGTVHIPIERAIDLMADEPARLRPASNE